MAGQRLQKDRRKTKPRRIKSKLPEDELIDLLRRQARSRAAANRRAFVEPSEPEKFLEWKAADMILDLKIKWLEGIG